MTVGRSLSIWRSTSTSKLELMLYYTLYPYIYHAKIIYFIYIHIYIYICIYVHAFIFIYTNIYEYCNI